MSQLDTKHGREQLLTEVWGPPSRRRKIRGVAKASGGGLGGGAAAEGCGQCSGCDLGGASLEGIVVVIVVALVIVIAYYLIKWGVAAWRRHKSKLRPRGALLPGPRVSRRHGVTGRVVGTESALSPVSDEPCLAYGAVFSYKSWWRPKLVLLRDAATVGFDVHGPDGRIVRVPAGVIVVAMAGSRSVDIHPDGVEIYLRQIDPLRESAPAGDYDPIPHRPPALPSAVSIDEVLIRPDASVHVQGPFESRPDVQAEVGGYREAAPSVLVPVGIPRLVLQGPTD